MPSKLVLQIYRDYVATENEDFVRDTWDVVEQVITRTAQFDTDDDGVFSFNSCFYFMHIL